ncbi:DEAD/DEAH box helicase [Xenorhabdus sp. KK7.4]|uniref:DEAD/DEAH box helicase n=1 Tax=Xenorhabdus sp. KK7.4 TaxID=1851572 RepID=UPI000C03E85B|nr:AAA domain-containing protein [Xenorhabdus sp. KK7.4]PHM59267.1 nuclease [Xenorhabdus sp. KK7.4]
MELKSVLKELKEFVYAEREANLEKLMETWVKTLHEKLSKGETQIIKSVKQVDSNYLEVVLGNNDSRFREGDMLCLHLGEAHINRHIQQATIEAENDNSWLLRVDKLNEEMLSEILGGCYADPDSMDLTPFYDKALDEITESKFGREIILPLLSGQLNTDFIFENDYDDAADYAQERKLNEQQSDAVGKGVAAKYLACIQGPPGTGKTKVISIIAKLLVESGQRVFMTSHTHMAINNALNKIAEENIPVIKVCGKGGTKALSNTVGHHEYASNWKEMPDSGYVIGATPFATCSQRLEEYDFDTIIFDEASQITLPLALIAMRKGRRFVFVGDHKQLPPVILSESVLSDCSAFSRMISKNQEVSTLLDQTYRMSQELTEWPSNCYYNGKLTSERAINKSIFNLPHQPQKYMDILSSKHPFVFIKTPGINAKSANLAEAKLVAELIGITIEAGLSAEEIGVVTPFRSHAKILKSCLANKLGIFASKSIVTDTVERMQGQEREMMIISLCSSDPQYISAIASFFFQPERLNVAITRAQTKLILVGPDLPEYFLSETDDEELRKNIEDYRSLICHGYYVEQMNNG